MILVKHIRVGFTRTLLSIKRTVGHGINGTIPIGSALVAQSWAKERIESINMGEMAWLIGNTDS